MLKLDFTLETSEARRSFINDYIAQNNDNNFTPAELETMANYILYGKNEDGESAVDRKEVEIETRYGTYQKKRPESLDALIENPSFNEGMFLKPLKQNYYKTPKPKIDREKDADIPGIQELWELIDHWQYLIDVTTGKIEDPEVKKLSPLNLYKARHYLVELRRQQFYLKDAVKPTILMYKTNVRESYYPVSEEIDWDSPDSNFCIAPLGMISLNSKKFYAPKDKDTPDYQYNEKAKYTIDFRKPEHIYYLLEAYEDLRCAADNNPESVIGNLLDTLDFYQSRAKLSDIKERIIELKKKKIQNTTIQEKINKEFGTSYSANYISTIWKQRICEDIAEAANLHYDYFLNRKEPFAWKKCNQCGELKLKDTREFMRKSRSSDGLAGRCKDCDKKMRDSRKKSRK